MKLPGNFPPDMYLPLCIPPVVLVLVFQLPLKLMGCLGLGLLIPALPLIIPCRGCFGCSCVPGRVCRFWNCRLSLWNISMITSTSLRMNMSHQSQLKCIHPQGIQLFNKIRVTQKQTYFIPRHTCCMGHPKDIMPARWIASVAGTCRCCSCCCLAYHTTRIYWAACIGLKV